MVNDTCFPDVDLPLGFLDVREMSLTKFAAPDVISAFAMTHERFLRPDEIMQLAASEPPHYGLLKPRGAPGPIFPQPKP